MRNLIEDLAVEVWKAVEARRAPALDTPRLYAAIYHHLVQSAGSYDPEVDHKVEYLRAVLRDLRAKRLPRPDAVLHALIGSMCGLAEPGPLLRACAD